MCLALDSILGNQQTHDVREHFDHVFQRLLDTRALSPEYSGEATHSRLKLANAINDLATHHEYALHSLPENDDYSRNIIGIEGTWIGFICRWQPHTMSSIHGHPSFAYYQVLSGSMLMDIYEPINDRQARQVSTRDMHPGESVLSTAPEGRYDNFVHRVKTKGEPVYTLHLYSDNPAKGKMFETV